MFDVVVTHSFLLVVLPSASFHLIICSERLHLFFIGSFTKIYDKKAKAKAMTKVCSNIIICLKVLFSFSVLVTEKVKKSASGDICSTEIRIFIQIFDHILIICQKIEIYF